MTRQKRCLVLQYDEEGDEIVLFSVPASDVPPLRGDEGFEMPLSDFRALAPEEAERRIGEGVFTMFDAFADRKTGIRDYAGRMTSDIEQMVADLEPTADRGNPQAQYDLSILYHDLVRRQLSWTHFDRAEALTRSAAEAGLPAAIQALAGWPTLRYAFSRHVERSKSA